MLLKNEEKTLPWVKGGSLTSACCPFGQWHVAEDEHTGLLWIHHHFRHLQSVGTSRSVAVIGPNANKTTYVRYLDSVA